METECVIIGAGQCGLYLAKHLQDSGIDYVLLEQGTVAQGWQNRFADLPLFTSRQFSQLPGLALLGEPNGLPKVEEMVAYFSVYAKQFGLKIKEHCEVVSVEKVQNTFKVELQNGDVIAARVVVNATGSNQQPAIPAIAKKLPKEILQFSSQSQDVFNLAQGSSVLIVGAGASGRHLAKKLTEHCHVTLAVGKNRALPANTILGKNLFWWLSKLGVLQVKRSSILGKILAKRDPVPCASFNNSQLKENGVRLTSRLLDYKDNKFVFENLELAHIDAVIWATGYKDNTSWLKIPEAIVDGQFLHQQGKTPIAGLFIIGRKWFSCRASELILGVAKDVAYLSTEIQKYLKNTNKEEL